jgi:hypothetical protein
MPKIKIFIINITALIIFSSCQRELFFPEVDSAGTLKSNGTGDCLPSTLHGVYKAASAVTTDNYLEVNTDVTSAGLYNIVSDTVNGYFFSARGKFEKKGVYTVQLTCKGTPVAKGTNIFTIKYGSSICKIAIVADSTVILTGIDTTLYAAYTLGGNPNDCSPVLINGLYIADYALGNLNTVKIQVNVTTTGSYTITTDTVNGIKFSATGRFTNTGVQTVDLKGSGVPTADGKYFYSVSGRGGQRCSFLLEVAKRGKFTFSGAPGDCQPFTVEGIYKSGTALTAANKVIIQVDVFSIGEYILSTDFKNGFSFYAAGVFTSTGIQNVVMTASFTEPLDSGTFTFTPQPNTSTCRFSVPVL